VDGDRGSDWAPTKTVMMIEATHTSAPLPIVTTNPDLDNIPLPVTLTDHPTTAASSTMAIVTDSVCLAEFPAMVENEVDMDIKPPEKPAAVMDSMDHLLDHHMDRRTDSHMANNTDNLTVTTTTVTEATIARKLAPTVAIGIILVMAARVSRSSVMAALMVASTLLCRVHRTTTATMIVRRAVATDCPAMSMSAIHAEVSHRTTATVALPLMAEIVTDLTAATVDSAATTAAADMAVRAEDTLLHTDTKRSFRRLPIISNKHFSESMLIWVCFGFSNSSPVSVLSIQCRLILSACVDLMKLPSPSFHSA
jgi:hypothetical protein